MIMNNNRFFITDGISNDVWRSSEKAIQNNSEETFKVILSFVRQVIKLSVEQRSINHFKEYISFFASFYNSSYEKAKYNTALRKLHEVCSDSASRHLKEIIWFDIGVRTRAVKSLGEKRELNDFYYHAFNGFSQLLYLIVRNTDHAQFKVAYNQFENILNTSASGNYEQRIKKRLLQNDNANGVNDEAIKALNEEIDVNEQFETYRRHVLIGLRYWIIFLYSVKKITEEDANEFLGKIRLPYVYPEDKLKDILFVRSEVYPVRNYMNWEGWDYMERPEGQAYTPPSPSLWMTFGFLVDQIREGSLLINQNELEMEDIRNAQFLYEIIKNQAESIANQFDHWKNILNVENSVALEGKINGILELFASIKRQSIGARERAIAAAPLHEEYVTNFKAIIGESWEREARIHKLFKHYGNVELIEDDNIKLKIVGQRNFFEKAKMMFIEGENYSWIYGVESMGGNVGRWEDNEFFNTAMRGEYNKAGGSSLLEVLDKIIIDFQNKNITPNLILLASEYSYQDEQFLKSKRFVSKLNEPHEEGLPFYLLGTFDGIPVYSSFSSFLDNAIVVCDFNAAFKMRYKARGNWYKEELNVDVRPVTDAEAQARLQENSAKWKTTEDGGQLSDADALVLIKTSIHIDIWTVLDFVVLDKESYVIGYINANNN